MDQQTLFILLAAAIGAVLYSSISSRAGVAAGSVATELAAQVAALRTQLAADRAEHLRVTSELQNKINQLEFENKFLKTNMGRMRSILQQKGVVDFEETINFDWLREIREKMAFSLNATDIKTVAWDMGLDYETLDPQNLAMDVVNRLNKQHKILELLELLRERHPHGNWPSVGGD